MQNPCAWKSTVPRLVPGRALSRGWCLEEHSPAAGAWKSTVPRLVGEEGPAWRGAAGKGGSGRNTQDSAACVTRVSSNAISSGNPLKLWKAICCLSGVKDESMCLPVRISFCFQGASWFKNEE